MKRVLMMLLKVISFNSVAEMNPDGIHSTVICVDGYKFLTVYYINRPPSVVQMYEQGRHDTRPSQPMRCDGKKAGER
jgi:hypothetical protein